jgi:hypothetical protein
MPSEAKALDIASFTYGLKPVPFNYRVFPQPVKPDIFSSLMAQLKLCPDTKHEFFRSL